MNTMERILRMMAERKGSDIYLSADSAALIRINGTCVPINAQILPTEAPMRLLSEVIHPSRIEELERTGELNMAIQLPAPATTASARCASAAATRWWCAISRSRSLRSPT